MTRALKWTTLVLAILAVLTVAGIGYVRVTGLRARATPGRLEARVARLVRSFAVPGGEQDRPNPIPRSDETINDGLEHFADHCAICHANDGSGMTDFGRGLFPRPPDLRAPATQQMTDGELFYVIENGVRFTGMPAFGTGTASGEEESWKLVQFIRHLPQLSEAELEKMKGLNPRSLEEVRQEIQEEEFLRGGPVAPDKPAPTHKH